MSIVVAILILVAGVGAIYLLLKKMTEEGIDIAPPGSCRRNRCGVKQVPVEEINTSRGEDSRGGPNV